MSNPRLTSPPIGGPPAWDRDKNLLAGLAACLILMAPKNFTSIDTAVQQAKVGCGICRLYDEIRSAKPKSGHIL
jgi:hypothetical protein